MRISDGNLELINSSLFSIFVFIITNVIIFSMCIHFLQFFDSFVLFSFSLFRKKKKDLLLLFKSSYFLHFFSLFWTRYSALLHIPLIKCAQSSLRCPFFDGFVEHVLCKLNMFFNLCTITATY